MSKKRVLVVFGSTSDSDIYTPICDYLSQQGIDHTLRIASAHKSPELLDTFLEKEDFNIVIAGAGLAAHLPGVIASKIIKPVIGIPCKGNYSGLDALLSIIQMPGGIPVLSTAINGKGFETVLNLNEEIKSVNIISFEENKLIEKCTRILDRFGVNYSKNEEPVNKSVNIHFVDLEDGSCFDDFGGVIINVPVKQDSKAKNVRDIFRLVRSQLWVGLNRGENAALAAIKLLNFSGNYDSKLNEYRQELQLKFK